MKEKNPWDGKGEGYGGCLVWFIPLIAILLISCNRKLHTEKTVDTSKKGNSINIDSLIEANKTISAAYENLLQTSNSSDVTVSSCPPCPGVGMVTMPHSQSSITIHPDGSKTINGDQIKYKDKAETLQQISTLKQENESLKSQLSKKDTSYHEQTHIETVKTVRVSFTPLLIWILLIAGWVLWINERFKLFNIPFLTRKK